mmetsp:Transcript_10766/g.41796  ORF Transcript_10766/g.41796 Transcript_10766/m.41796 type:complete len:221 (-) Transcript_10766:352-1014(-)
MAWMPRRGANWLGAWLARQAQPLPLRRHAAAARRQPSGPLRARPLRHPAPSRRPPSPRRRLRAWLLRCCATLQTARRGTTTTRRASSTAPLAARRWASGSRPGSCGKRSCRWGTRAGTVSRHWRTWWRPRRARQRLLVPLVGAAATVRVANPTWVRGMRRGVAAALAPLLQQRLRPLPRRKPDPRPSHWSTLTTMASCRGRLITLWWHGGWSTVCSPSSC